MTIFFDIDGVLCTNENGVYEKAKPLQKNIDKLNRLFKLKHRIILWTARGATTKIDWSDLTKKQLKEWGVNYTELRLDKPHYDIFYDDKAEKL